MSTPSPQELLAALEASMTDMSEAKLTGRVGIAGDSGVGKTVLAMEIAQAITPPDKRILYLDFLDGFVTLTQPRHAHLQKRTQRVMYEGYSQIRTLKNAIDAGIRNPNGSAGKFGDFGCIVLDEISSMVEKDLTSISRARAADGKMEDADDPDNPEYQRLKFRFMSMYQELCELPIHLIFVTHVRKAKNSKGIEGLAPSFTPSVIPTYVRPLHVSALMTADVKNNGGVAEYTRQCQAHPTTLAWGFKTRIGSLPVFLSPDALREAITDALSGKRSVTEEGTDAQASTQVTSPDDNLVIEVN